MTYVLFALNNDNTLLITLACKYASTNISLVDISNYRKIVDQIFFLKAHLHMYL
jgi:hypothetical protein